MEGGEEEEEEGLGGGRGLALLAGVAGKAHADREDQREEVPLAMALRPQSQQHLLYRNASYTATPQIPQRLLYRLS